MILVNIYHSFTMSMSLCIKNDYTPDETCGWYVFMPSMIHFMGFSCFQRQNIVLARGCVPIANNLCTILKQPIMCISFTIRLVSLVYLDQPKDEMLKQPLRIPHSGTIAEFHRLSTLQKSQNLLLANRCHIRKMDGFRLLCISRNASEREGSFILSQKTWQNLWCL